MGLKKILVWDWPVRIGHWLLVLAFATAWLTSEAESWQTVHFLAGGLMVGIVLFRFLWGFWGTRYARFADFVHGPSAVFLYLKGMLRLQPAHSTGHNPLGGWAIVAMLVLILATGASGWALHAGASEEIFEELHEGLASLTLGVVIVHLAGVLSARFVHGENLVLAMFSGRKLGQEGSEIRSARPFSAALLLACAAGGAWLAAFWL